MTQPHKNLWNDLTAMHDRFIKTWKKSGTHTHISLLQSMPQMYPVQWRFQSPGTFCCDNWTAAPDSSALKHQELLSQWKCHIPENLYLQQWHYANLKRKVHPLTVITDTPVMLHISMICLCAHHICYIHHYCNMSQHNKLQYIVCVYAHIYIN